MSAAATSLLALAATHSPSQGEVEPAWLETLRDTARVTFEEHGIPTRRLETWKGTSLAALEAMRFARVGPIESNPVVVTGDGSPELVFVDGRLDTASTSASHLPNGVRLLSLAEARRQEPQLLEGRLARLADPKKNALVALQTAFLDDGAVLVIDPGVELDTPIRMRFVASASSGPGSDSTSSAAFPRLLVIAGEASQGAVWQEFESDAAESDAAKGGAPGLTAFVAEFHLAAGARIESVEIQNEGAERVHFTSAHARLERDARFDSHVFSLGNGLVRSELEVILAEPGAQTRMRGFFLGRDDGHVDHFTTADHEAAHCTSDEEYRGVLADRSAGVFRGRVIVRPDAQKTDARQSNPNLLLSDKASIDTKPQLEIYADDIRASHGSTIGQLDADALFFLRARGIDPADARLLLTRAFAHAIVDAVVCEEIRESLTARVDDALGKLEAPTNGGAA